MRRREFIAGLGSVAAWPVVAGAQQDGRVRRIAVLLGAAIDGSASERFGAFRDAMAKLGWIEGRNLRIDFREGANDPDRIRASAIELVGLGPDAIVSASVAATRAMQQQTQDIPIIFAAVGGDPVAIGLVTSIARPEGNVTGFTNLFNEIGGKWIELLKNAAPRVRRVALVFQPITVNNRLLAPINYIRSAEAAARALAVQSTRMPVRDDVELVRAIDAFASEQNGGLVGVPPVVVNRGLLFRLWAQYGLPAIFPEREFVTDGGQLMSYGSNFADLFRSIASYVDPVLRGAKVSELPVQHPTKFELVINLKTAKALGLTMPETLLATADEVIR
jgi:putative ABC transport system substrate-binding protein